MKVFPRIFAPTNNRRLNELIGFLLCVSALLLFLAVASYSPLDPSLNSASVLTGSRAARNWVGVVGALVSDLMLQGFGVGAFLIPLFAAVLGMRWFRSRIPCISKQFTKRASCPVDVSASPRARRNCPIPERHAISAPRSCPDSTAAAGRERVAWIVANSYFYA